MSDKPIPEWALREAERSLIDPEPAVLYCVALLLVRVAKAQHRASVGRVWDKYADEGFPAGWLWKQAHGDPPGPVFENDR